MPPGDVSMECAVAEMLAMRTSPGLVAHSVERRVGRRRCVRSPVRKVVGLE